MPFAVSVRARVRIALGASRPQVLRLVLSDGLRLGMVGIVIGVFGSIGAAALLSSQLYGVKATDPWTFTFAALLLMFVAAAAGYMPARRAARVDPINVLRDE